MSDLSSWVAVQFQRGGPTMFQIEYIGIAGVIVAGFHMYRARRWSLITGGVLAVLALVSGIHARSVGRDMTDKGVTMWESTSTPDEIAAMRAEGYAEAAIPFEFGAIVAGGLVILIGAGELRGRLRSAARRSR